VQALTLTVLAGLQGRFGEGDEVLHGLGEVLPGGGGVVGVGARGSACGRGCG
jgi:hypothetical protein